MGEPTIYAKYRMSLAILNNEIEEADYKSQCILPIVLDVYSKLYHKSEWRTYLVRNSQLWYQHVQAFSMIRVQCMQVLLDNMKHDPDWDNTSES